MLLTAVHLDHVGCLCVCGISMLHMSSFDVVCLMQAPMDNPSGSAMLGNDVLVNSMGTLAHFVDCFHGQASVQDALQDAGF